MRVLTVAPSVAVVVHDRGCLTVYRDGSSLPATPHDTTSYRDDARWMGYRSTRDSCVEHEAMHEFLAVARGLPWSPTKWYEANREAPVGPRGRERAFATLVQRRREEAEVMTLQRFMNTGRLDVDPHEVLAPLACELVDLHEFRTEFLRLMAGVTR